MKLQPVAFDLDGTLYPNSKLFLRAVPYFLTNLRLTINFGKVREEIRNMRPIDDFYVLQSELLAEKMGITVARASHLIISVVYGAWKDVMRGISPFPGVKEMLAELKRRKIKLAVLSDFPVDEKLKILGLEGYWDYANSSEKVGYLKPNPEPFYHVANSLEIDPELIMFVGNSFEWDIRGAMQIGMKTAHFSRKAPRGSQADITFSDFRGLIDRLKDSNFL
jgi:putative hydrolase of the HAD superfamily